MFFKMHFLRFNLCFIMLLFLFFCASKAQYYSRSMPDAEGETGKTIIVDQKGQGNFTSVQAAIDSIPRNNNLWTRIYIKAGIYNEKVRIAQNKPFIVLQGESQKTTIIQWGEAGSSSMSPTFRVDGENFVAANISFVNTYNLAIPNEAGRSTLWAPAAGIYTDKASFYQCSFLGVQDTLTDSKGRHYFRSCYFEGRVDFIWGRGQSIYEQCVINATGPGYITAQARESEDDESGFVFIDCSIAGNSGPVCLGRAYKSYSRVVFKNTYMPDIIKPEGWSAWDQTGKEDTITYSEVECKGPGADKSKRVKWEKNLPPEDLNFLTNINTFINKDGWLEKQPKLQ